RLTCGMTCDVPQGDIDRGNCLNDLPPRLARNCRTHCFPKRPTVPRIPTNDPRCKQLIDEGGMKAGTDPAKSFAKTNDSIGRLDLDDEDLRDLMRSLGGFLWDRQPNAQGMRSNAL